MAAATAAGAAAVLFATTAWAADSMTLTFVRHGESEGNASGIIDTSIPGPDITELGQQESADVAVVLAERDAQNPYDGIYWSQMVRTAQTAEPTVDALDEQGGQLPGVHELSAGIFEGQSENDGIGRIGYILAPLTWMLGAQFVATPGAESGTAFDVRMDDSIQTIYDNGDRNAIVFSHGGTIMFWTLMNVENPDFGLLLEHPLENTDIVVVEGNEEDGWVLTEWAGQPVAAEPSLGVKLFVNVRDLVTAPQSAAYRIGQAFETGDIETIANAIREGVTDVAETTFGFPGEMVNDIVESFDDSAADAGTEEQAATLAVAARSSDSDAPAVDTVEADTDAAVTEPSNTEVSEPTAAKQLKKAKNALEARGDGGTDLTGGNKFMPGERLSAARERAEQAAEDVRSEIESSVQKAGDTVQKIADRISDDGADDNGEDNDNDKGAEGKDAA